MAYDSRGGTVDDARLIVQESGGSIIQPTPASLVGLNLRGTRLWTQDQIELSAISRIKDGTAYIVGWDRTDNLTLKVFFLDTGSGQIIDRIDVTNIGSNVGVGPHDEVYVTGGNRVFRLR